MLLDVKNLRAGYEQNTEVLHDLNFQLAAGESLAIVGANGAGKSTLLNVLLGFVPFTGSTNLFMFSTGHGSKGSSGSISAHRFPQTAARL